MSETRGHDDPYAEPPRRKTIKYSEGSGSLTLPEAAPLREFLIFEHIPQTASAGEGFLSVSEDLNALILPRHAMSFRTRVIKVREVAPEVKPKAEPSNPQPKENL